VITGGESGPRYRRVDPEWVISIRDQCCRSNVAFFHKQWGGPTAKSGGPPARRTYSQGTAMPDVDKRAACQSDILVGIMWRTQGSFRSRSRSSLSRDLGSYCPAEKAKLRKRESLYLVLRTDTDSPEASAFAIRRYAVRK
jgi:hypothetical protein